MPAWIGFCIGLLVGGTPTVVLTITIERAIYRRLRLHVCDNDRHTH